MKTVKKIGRTIMDILGVGFPCVIYLVLFLSFVATIVMRYCFAKSLAWGNEVAVLAYMWIMFFGCGKAIENDEHVVFSLVYDKCSPKVQMLMKVFYNVLLAVLIAIAIPPCVRLLMKSTQITGILKIPYKICFAPYIWMLAETVVRSLINVKKAIDEYKNPVHPTAAELELKDAEQEVTA